MITRDSLLRLGAKLVPQTRNRRLMAGGAFAALALPLSLAVMADPGSSRPGGGGQASAFGSAGASMMAMLGLRSPGERSQGELADTKARQKVLADATIPHERALAKIRTPTIPLAAPAPPGGPIGPVDEMVPAALRTPSPLSGSPLADIGRISNPGNTPPGSPPGPGGGPPGSPPGGTIEPPPPPPPPPPGAVPEPSIWALMMLGIGAIGTSLRKRRRDELATAAAGTFPTVA